MKQTWVIELKLLTEIASIRVLSAIDLVALMENSMKRVTVKEARNLQRCIIFASISIDKRNYDLIKWHGILMSLLKKSCSPLAREVQWRCIVQPNVIWIKHNSIVIILASSALECFFCFFEEHDLQSVGTMMCTSFVLQDEQGDYLFMLLQTTASQLQLHSRFVIANGKKFLKINFKDLDAFFGTATGLIEFIRKWKWTIASLSISQASLCVYNFIEYCRKSVINVILSRLFHGNDTTTLRYDLLDFPFAVISWFISNAIFFLAQKRFLLHLKRVNA